MTHIVINMNNMTHSQNCLLTVSHKCILLKPIIIYLLHYACPFCQQGLRLWVHPFKFTNK